MLRALLIAAGTPDRTLAAIARLAARPDLVVGVDGGVEVAIEAGIPVDVAIGDFDSLAPSLVDRLSTLAGEVVRHPADKDASDLELALDWCVAAEVSAVLVAGIEGDRPDHTLSSMLLVASDRYRSLDRSVLRSDGQAWVLAAGDALALDGVPTGTTVSVIAVHGDARVSLAGVRWPLDRAVLGAGSTLGVSNRVTGPGAIQCHAGVVWVIVADAADAADAADPADPGA